MAKIIIAPDQFKGSLSSLEICMIIKEEILKKYPGDHVTIFPLAAGGTGTVACFRHYLGGNTVTCATVDLFFRPVFASYLVSGDLAVMEMTSLNANGSTVGPLEQTSYGIGLMIKDAINRGIKRIIIGLGDNTISDGGCGMAMALGTVFYDRNWQSFTPVGKTMNKIWTFDNTQTASLMAGIAVTGLAEVLIPLSETVDALSHLSQKIRVTEDELHDLDQQLEALGTCLKSHANDSLTLNEKGGTSGGMGAGLIGFLGAKLEGAVDHLLQMSGFDEELKGSRLLITAEGTIDEESFHGKALGEIIRRAGNANVPVVALCGQNDCPASFLKKAHICSINPENMPFHIAMKEAGNNLRHTVSELIGDDTI